MTLSARPMAEGRSWIPCACVLGAVALAACRGGAATTDTRTATGGCLGRVCLGMSEAAAVATLGAEERTDTRHCYHLRDGAFYSFWVDGEDPGRRVTGILATGAAHCADPREVDGAGTLVTCRGVRLGDAESFVAKIDRRAVEADKPSYPWPEAPEGTRQLDDDCGPEPDAEGTTTIYVLDGKVAGLAIWETD